jgi:hypothetical protein
MDTISSEVVQNMRRKIGGIAEKYPKASVCGLRVSVGEPITEQDFQMNCEFWKEALGVLYENRKKIPFLFEMALLGHITGKALPPTRLDRFLLRHELFAQLLGLEVEQRREEDRFEIVEISEPYIDLPQGKHGLSRNIITVALREQAWSHIASFPGITEDGVTTGMRIVEIPARQIVRLTLA